MGNYDWQSEYNHIIFDLVTEPYTYDVLMVIKHEGEYYIGTDSGCSCPYPFENYNGLDDMTGPMTLEHVIDSARALVTTMEEAGEKPDMWFGGSLPTEEQLENFINQLERL